MINEGEALPVESEPVSEPAAPEVVAPVEEVAPAVPVVEPAVEPVASATPEVVADPEPVADAAPKSTPQLIIDQIQAGFEGSPGVSLSAFGWLVIKLDELRAAL